MPIRNFPFSIIRPGDLARPYLPVTVINPDIQKQVKVYALLDTGADECAFPASFAVLLGHNLQAGRLKRISTGNGVTTAYSHTTRITLLSAFFAMLYALCATPEKALALRVSNC